MSEVKLYRPTLQKSGQTRTGYVAFMTDKADPRDSEWRGEDSREWVRYRDYAALQARIAELEARNAASERDDLCKLQGFAAAMLDWDMDGIGDVDGGTLQDLAEHHGLLVPVQVSEPCGESCLCADYGDFPQACYRKSETLKRAFAATKADAHAQGQA